MSERPNPLAALLKRQQRRQELRLARALHPIEWLDATRVRVDGRELINFASNDYLGLAADPELGAAFAAAAARRGGSGASPLICGYTKAHEALAGELATWLGYERVLLFSSGYQCALAVIPALIGRGALCLMDRLCHACLIDGARLSGAKLLRYRHLDLGHAETLLAGRPQQPALIVSDAVFSMDGDEAPLAELAALAARERALLLVDDAHGLGVLGPEGRGSVAEAGLAPHAVPLLMDTFGKSFGLAGAFLAGPAELIEALLSEARGLIYSTAPPPAHAEALRVALALVREGEARRQKLRGLIERFRALAAAWSIPLLPSRTPIQPVLLGDAERALAVSSRLQAMGFLVPAIRPPTVPAGTARLRVSLSAAHEEAEVEALATALAEVLAEGTKPA
ncbi:MAG: 8-amino-7-oxononanoate synthase [Lysobacterales bacterium]|jgi:8-amino-7-oxononanoate synthase|nr:MAG: 8-amino-7-oxononanoate synthase [Xanthomonadales bacterium]